MIGCGGSAQNLAWFRSGLFGYEIYDPGLSHANRYLTDSPCRRPVPWWAMGFDSSTRRCLGTVSLYGGAALDCVWSVDLIDAIEGFTGGSPAASFARVHSGESRESGTGDMAVKPGGLAR